MNMYLIRHCRAEGQAPEAPLTDAGRRQAEALAELLYVRNISAIVASPYVRAVQSIEPLARRLALPVRTDERLKERVLSGVDRPDWQEMLQHTFTDPDLCYEGGESSRNAACRALSAIDDARSAGGADTAVVTHGNLLALVLRHYTGEFGYAEWARLSNPDVFRVSLDNGTPVVERIWRDDRVSGD